MKPIIFSTPMVQAILDGRKTMTRRIIKPQPEFCIASDIRNRQPLAFWVDNARWVKPRYQPGDILWVRETFCEVPYEYNHIPIKGGHITTPKYAYKADSKRDYTGIWKPSIHMPKEAARIWLEVTDVRVERLQEITEEDARAEGALPTREERGYNCCRDEFITLWDSINSKRGYGWDSNPWVWVIEFERVGGEYIMAELKSCPFYGSENIQYLTEGQCHACQDEKSMPYVYCCLAECGEHEFCRGCDKGIYLSTKEEQNASGTGGLNDSNNG